MLVGAAVAKHLLDLGQTDRGTEILRATVAAARELPGRGRGGVARVRLASLLARTDQEAAKDLVRGVGLKSESPPLWLLLDLAAELASWHPVRSEQIVKSLPPTMGVSRALPRICHAMTARDYTRARQVLDRVDVPTDPFARSYALGVMALAAAQADKTLAERLLREAFADLAQRASQGISGPNHQDAATIGSLLLPVAERISPDLVEEILWEALSFRRERGGDRTLMGRDWFDPALALFLSRYDRAAAGVLYEPLAARFGAEPSKGLDARSAALGGRGDRSGRRHTPGRSLAGRKPHAERQPTARLERRTLDRACHLAGPGSIQEVGLRRGGDPRALGCGK